MRSGAHRTFKCGVAVRGCVQRKGAIHLFFKSYRAGGESDSSVRTFLRRQYGVLDQHHIAIIVLAAGTRLSSPGVDNTAAL